MFTDTVGQEFRQYTRMACLCLMLSRSSAGKTQLKVTISERCNHLEASSFVCVITDGITGTLAGLSATSLTCILATWSLRKC